MADMVRSKGKGEDSDTMRSCAGHSPVSNKLDKSHIGYGFHFIFEFMLILARTTDHKAAFRRKCLIVS